jgi:hypothetical protein
MRKKTGPAQEPEKRNGKQGAKDHGQSDKEPDLFLMRRQTRSSPASVVMSHNFHPGQRRFAIGCATHEDYHECGPDVSGAFLP